MRQILSHILIMLTVVFITGCQDSKPVPEWVHDPGDGAVGSAVTHIRGRHHQEELAIARARERLAARYGVDVSSVQTIHEKVVNDKAYVTSNKEIFQQVNKATVKAHVREIWYDKSKDEIWAWVYPMN